MSGDFDADLARLDQIRRSHESARPTSENPAWGHTHADLTFVLGFLDKAWKEYSRTLAEADRLREALKIIAEGTVCPELFPDETDHFALAAKTAMMCAIAALERK